MYWQFDSKCIDNLIWQKCETCTWIFFFSNSFFQLNKSYKLVVRGRTSKLVPIHSISGNLQLASATAPPVKRSPLTWSEHVRPSCPGTPSPSGPPSSEPAHLTWRALPLQGLPLKDAMVSSTATQDFLHQHHGMAGSVQETKLGVNTTLKELTCHANKRHAGGGGFVTFVRHSIRYRVPDGDYPMTTRWNFCQLRLTSGEPHWLLSTCTFPCIRNYTPDFWRPFWWTKDTRWCSRTSLPACPPSQRSPSWGGISSQMWRGPPLPP